MRSYFSVGCRCAERCGIYPTTRVVDENYLLERGDCFGLEARGGEVWCEGFEQGDVGARRLERKIGLRPNDEVRGLEVRKSGDDLSRVEGWIQRHEYRAELEEGVGGCSELDVVPKVDCNAVPFLHSHILQASCQGIAPQVELVVGQALSLVPRDDSRAVSVSRHDLGEVFADSIFE